MNFASTASLQRLAAAHRNAVILARYQREAAAPAPKPPVSNDVRDRRIAGLAKARAIKAARRAEEAV